MAVGYRDCDESKTNYDGDAFCLNNAIKENESEKTRDPYEDKELQNTNVYHDIEVYLEHPCENKVFIAGSSKHRIEFPLITRDDEYGFFKEKLFLAHSYLSCVKKFSAENRSNITIDFCRGNTLALFPKRQEIYSELLLERKMQTHNYDRIKSLQNKYNPISVDVFVLDGVFTYSISRIVEVNPILVQFNKVEKEASYAFMCTLLEEVLSNQYRTFEHLFRLATPVTLKSHHRFPQACFRLISKHCKDVIREKDLLDDLFTFDNDFKQRRTARWNMKTHNTSLHEFHLKEHSWILQGTVKSRIDLNKVCANNISNEEKDQPKATRSILTKMLFIFCLLESIESLYTSIIACTSLICYTGVALLKSSRKDQQTFQLKKFFNGKVDILRDLKKPDYGMKSIKSLGYLLNGDKFKPANTDLVVFPLTKGSIEPVLSRYMTGRRPTREEAMSYELLRLCTMHDLPNPSSLSFMRLAQAGFFYTGNGNELVCFSCGFKKNDWSETDDPLDIHRTMSPGCAFFDNMRSSNTPVRYAEDTASQLLLQDHTDLEVDNTQIDGELENLSSTAQTNTTENNDSTGQRYVNHDMVYDSCLPGSARIPQQPESRSTEATNDVTMQGDPQHMFRYPEYNTFSARLCTYAKWNKKQIPRDLAHCGLFYIGTSDCVRCFDCGIGLKNWDPDDNPWIEHARWSSKCNYLKTVKGEGFIKLVMEAAKSVEEPRSTGYDDSGNSSRHTTGSDSATASGGQSSQTNKANNDGDILTSQIDSTLKPQTNQQGNEKLGDAQKTSGTNSLNKGNAALKEKHVAASAETTVKHSIAKPQNIEHIKSEQKDSGYSSGSPQDCDTETLKKEIKQMTDQTICKVCLDLKVETVFLPCGHLVCCTKCSPSLKKCPICRKRISKKLRAHVGV